MKEPIVIRHGANQVASVFVGGNLMCHIPSTFRITDEEFGRLETEHDRCGHVLGVEQVRSILPDVKQSVTREPMMIERG